MNKNGGIRIFVNGEEKSIQPETAFLFFLESAGLEAKSLVAEINGKILPQKSFGEYILQNGDKVEVIRFVGGG